jgi:hypothetical protein
LIQKVEELEDEMIRKEIEKAQKANRVDRPASIN